MYRAGYSRAPTSTSERIAALTAELLLLAVHSVLHLLGYDHETPAEDAAMRELERAALARAGCPHAARRG